jgi:hypothetical protein
MHYGGVVELLLDGAGGSWPGEGLEAGPRVAVAPGGCLDGLPGKGFLDLIEASPLHFEPLFQSRIGCHIPSLILEIGSL